MDFTRKENPIIKNYFQSSKGKYIIKEHIGSGSYGDVFRGVNLITNEIVALKTVKINIQENEGFPISTLREVKHVRMFNHKNIIKLKDVVITDQEIWNNVKKITDGTCLLLVFEYCAHDLHGLFVSQKHFTGVAVKSLMKQLLEAVEELHKKKCIHRDVKSANVLIGHDGVLKLADFGLCRKSVQSHLLSSRTTGHMTNRVVTLPYRAPELILGETRYNYSIDIWSIGCIFAEFMLRKIVFPGATAIETLEKIFSLLGRPNEQNWPGVGKLKYFKSLKMKTEYKNVFYETFNGFGEDCIDLLKKMLTLNPKERITATEALKHPWFKNCPKDIRLDLPLERSNYFRKRQMQGIPRNSQTKKRKNCVNFHVRKIPTLSKQRYKSNRRKPSKK